MSGKYENPPELGPRPTMAEFQRYVEELERFHGWRVDDVEKMQKLEDTEGKNEGEVSPPRSPS